MNGVRKATVKAMVKSVSENAAFTGMKDIDITSTFDTRAQLKDYATKNEIKLTYLAFIVKATAKALEEMPNVNVRIDAANNQILQIDNINIAIAVDTADGLMVPVIKEQITYLKKLSMAEMKDATFTVSNFGSVGLDYATPIINSPESAILGVGGMKKFQHMLEMK
ncbi:hypothetical protein FQA39_LY12805 [Lamprigera yunnana]|nr:hypothetical protein FQA39_LY12805 [Lamprigera yunnana]